MLQDRLGPFVHSFTSHSILLTRGNANALPIGEAMRIISMKSIVKLINLQLTRFTFYLKGVHSKFEIVIFVSLLDLVIFKVSVKLSKLTLI